MGSDETAITILGGPRVINVFDGNEAPSGPNYLLFVGTDRLADVLWDGSEVKWSPGPHVPALGALQRALDPKLWGIMVVVRALLGTCTDMYLLMESPAPAASAFAYVQYRPYAPPGRPQDHASTGFLDAAVVWEAGGGATLFVPGRSGGTASKRTDPMDDD